MPDFPITVHKLDADGHPLLCYQGHVLARAGSWVTLAATYRGEPVSLGSTTLKRGDQFVEHHYGDRWYNIFELYDVDDGRLKGWYCNVTRPAILTERDVAADDLALDLWVEPDGRVTLLDWDEFETLSLPPDEQGAALAALQELRDLVKTGKLPLTRR
jgi:hypothetical protein